MWGWVENNGKMWWNENGEYFEFTWRCAEILNGYLVKRLPKVLLVTENP